MTSPPAAAIETRLRAPLITCGVGFGGFFDGIVFHQILQLHHMVSNAGDDRLGLETQDASTQSGLRVNVLADGLFHAATYVALTIGLAWLWRRWRAAPPFVPSWRVLVGGIMTGWGLFNVIEGTVNHHVLGLHHVVEDNANELLFDLLFLASGVGLIATGLVLLPSIASPQSAAPAALDAAAGDAGPEPHGSTPSSRQHIPPTEPEVRR